jgi:long-subunit acyl-CoA synthetase (AMP-forming)
MLDIFELDEKSTVALYGRNSYNWIAIYIACLLKGVRLLIIHPKERKLEIVHILLLTNANHIFTDEDLVFEDLGKSLFLKSIISIDSLGVIFERTDRTVFTALAEILVSSEPTLNVDQRILNTILEEDDVESSVITATSGTEYYAPKWVESSTGSISDLLTKAMGVTPYNGLQTVYSKVEFAESHYVTVLLPFVKGCVFVGSKDDAEVVIENTNSIEKMWRKNVSYLYGNKFLSFLFSISWMEWLFKRIAIRKVWNYYGKKLKALVVYNSVMNEGILSILVGNLPIYTTYGSQETNQLVAINNFSSPKKRLPNAVGTALPGLLFKTYEDELEIVGTSLFNRYVGDESQTLKVRYRDNYLTGDIGFSDSDVLFVYGRASAIYHNEFKLPIQLDKLERIIKSIPYFKEVLLFPDNNKLYLLAYPDINMVETKGLGLLRLKELMKIYLNRINTGLNESVSIQNIVILTEPLKKNKNGKICRYFYS